MMPVAVMVTLVPGQLESVRDSSNKTTDSATLNGSPKPFHHRRRHCPSACNARCSQNWRNKICNKDCNICCDKCNCVPSGTGQETRSECPCYANLVDSKTGKLKCP
ncbi:hypothetical protein CFC21_020573 [Triticum aestivum]|uniref:Uncharacterized protein n=2 Tax=Triticum aestivum TaxID=4565 RepID=A0A9R1E7W6_WHEAT|nr:hypothetical protein CFC21_020573 [Triticum aestivum]